MNDGVPVSFAFAGMTLAWTSSIRALRHTRLQGASFWLSPVEIAIRFREGAGSLDGRLASSPRHGFANSAIISAIARSRDVRTRYTFASASAKFFVNIPLFASDINLEMVNTL